MQSQIEYYRGLMHCTLLQAQLKQPNHTLGGKSCISRTCIYAFYLCINILQQIISPQAETLKMLVLIEVQSVILRGTEVGYPKQMITQSLLVSFMSAFDIDHFQLVNSSSCQWSACGLRDQKTTHHFIECNTKDSQQYQNQTTQTFQMSRDV